MKVMNHAEYKESLLAKPTEWLRFTLKDAREARDLAGELGNMESFSYYADEVCYVAEELGRREREASK